VNETARKFGYPDTRLMETPHWVVLLRPVQVTLGSLVLCCLEPARRFGEISESAAAELKPVTTAIESALSAAFAHDRINYLMLMMVDPDVHFHVIPRYESPRSFEQRAYEDAAWPGPPDLGRALELPEAAFAALRRELASHFP